MKSFHSSAAFSAFAALLLLSAAPSFAQEKAPAAKPRIAPGTEPEVTQPEAAEPLPQAPAPKAAAPKRAPATLQEMVRGQRDGRWQRERDALRQSLEEVGVGDKKLQDAVVALAEAQDQSRETLRAAGARCWDALRDPNVGEAALSALLQGYREAAVQALAERDKALAELEARVHFTASPRLEMVLRLKGLLGTEGWLAGDALGEAESFDLRVLYPPTQ